MNKIIKTGVKTLSLIGAASLGVACGSATNNDQGVAFTNLGFFQGELDAGACGTLPQGLTGLSFPIGTIDGDGQGVEDAESGVGQGSGSDVFALVGAQNNLAGQIINTDRLELEYFIPGAAQQPPSTSLPFSVTLGPAEGLTGGGTDEEDGSPFDSTLPPTFADLCPQSFAQVFLIPASIRAWINLNRESLPEPPFQFEIGAQITGLTSGGDRLTTQRRFLTAVITPETLINPSPGSGTFEEGDLTEGSDTDTGDESLVGGDTTSGDVDVGVETPDSGDSTL